MKKKNYSAVQSFSARAAVQFCGRKLLGWKPVLLLASLLTALPLCSQVLNQSFSDAAGYKYRITSVKDRTVAIIGSTATGDIVIPSTVRYSSDLVFTVRVASSGGRKSYPNARKITLPNTCWSIYGSAFVGNEKLEEVVIPSSVSTVHETAFVSTFALQKITVVPESRKFKVVDGALLSYDETIMYAFPAGKQISNEGVYTLPSKVKEIKSGTFYGNASLKHLKIGPALTKIGVSAGSFAHQTPNFGKITVDPLNNNFKSIDNVLFNGDGTELIFYPQGIRETKFTLPKGCTTIGMNAIHNRYLTEIDLGEVTSLSQNAIHNCSQLTTLRIPATLPALSGDAVKFCVKLSNFIIDPLHKQMASKDGCIYSADESILYVVPEGKAGELRVSGKTTTISNSAALRCGELTKVIIPANVKTIEENAFSRCSKLATLEFEGTSTLTTIGRYAFYESAIRELNLPASITTIGDNAFRGATALHSVKIPNNSLLTSIADNAFDGITTLKTLTIGNNVALKTIGTRAFANTNIATVNLPNSLTNIGLYAFADNTALTSVSFATPAKVSTISEGAFAGCTKLANITVPSSVQTVGLNAFLNCSGLTRVELSVAAKSIHPEAFKGCSNLQEFTVAKGNTTYSAVKGMLCNAAKTELKIFPPGQAIDPKTKQSKNVVLLPPSLTKIGDYAFYSVPMLKQVTIPQRVTSIGNRAFGLCTKLTDIVFLCDQMIPAANIPTALNLAAFDEVHTGAVDQRKKITIYVRQGVLAAYQAEPYYKTGFKEIKSSFTVPYAGVAGSSCEYMPYSSTSVELLKVVAPGLKTFVASNEVVNPAEAGIKRSVQLIGDYAFQNTTLQEVIIKSPNVYSIGARAFVTSPITTGNTSTIQNIFFSSNNVPGVLKSVDFELRPEYNEFLSSQNIYVKKTMMDDFRAEAAWSKYLSRVQYKIPAPRINNYYTTFSREFDVDFEDGTANKQVHAFIANSKQLKNGSGDVGQPTQKKITFVTLTVAGKQGTYVPANTGVLIKNLGKTSPLDFYYRIGENDSETHTVGTNYLKPVTEKDKVLAANTSNYYVLQQGIFRFVNRTKTPTATVPVHKAYLDLGASGAASDLSLYFEGDDDLTTGLETVEVETTARAPYYRLDGTRVSAPGRGLYIHNGKKVFLNK